MDWSAGSIERDHEDRMVEATVNSVTSTYTYRGDGLRDSRTVGMTTTQFTWDPSGEGLGLPVVLDDGPSGEGYLYGAWLSAMKQSGDWYYYLADGLGSTMAVVDGSGVVQTSYQCDVYGEVTGGSGSLSNEFDFAGQQTDPTGLQYLRARYYDPATGVFLSREPLERLPGWMGNPFGYAGGNAVSRTDPTGLIPMEGCEPSCQVSAGPPGWFAPEGRWFERRGDDYYLCGMPDARIYNPAQPYCDKFDPAKVAAKTSACQLCDEVLLAGVGATWRIGEYTFTGSAKYGRDRMKAYRWTKGDLDKIKRGTRYRDAYGNTVYTRQNGDGTLDWLVESPEGHIVTMMRGADARQVSMAIQEMKWSVLP